MEEETINPDVLSDILNELRLQGNITFRDAGLINDVLMDREIPYVIHIEDDGVTIAPY